MILLSFVYISYSKVKHLSQSCLGISCRLRLDLGRFFSSGFPLNPGDMLFLSRGDKLPRGLLIYYSGDFLRGKVLVTKSVFSDFQSDTLNSSYNEFNFCSYLGSYAPPQFSLYSIRLCPSHSIITLVFGHGASSPFARISIYRILRFVASILVISLSPIFVILLALKSSALIQTSW